MTAVDERLRVATLFDSLAPTYDQGPVPWFRPIAARLVELLTPRAGEHALDVGAGRGAATHPLADAVGPTGHVTAVDVSPAMCAALLATPARPGSAPIEVVCGEAHPDVLGDRGFDVVAASMVLFFDPDPGESLWQWVELLNPGGRIGVTTFGPTDEAWAAADAAVFAHAPADMLDARTTGSREPFSSTDSLVDLFEFSGATGVLSHDEPLEVVLPDAAAWRDWTMTLGMRQAWLSIPKAVRPSVMESVAEALEANRGPDGMLHLTQQVRYTVGRAPA